MDAASTGARVDAASTISTPIDSNSTLKSVAHFPIGAAPASWLPKKSPKGFKLLEDQFSSKTVHAYMNEEVSQGKFDFTESDYWVKWAETHLLFVYMVTAWSIKELLLIGFLILKVLMRNLKALSKITFRR